MLFMTRHPATSLILGFILINVAIVAISEIVKKDSGIPLGNGVRFGFYNEKDLKKG